MGERFMSFFFLHLLVLLWAKKKKMKTKRSVPMCSECVCVFLLLVKCDVWASRVLCVFSFLYFHAGFDWYSVRVWIVSHCTTQPCPGFHREEYKQREMGERETAATERTERTDAHFFFSFFLAGKTIGLIPNDHPRRPTTDQLTSLVPYHPPTKTLFT
jgi:hypothetical protein